ncbi:MarR family winged helix-turn-helix transcriptional regulator [Salinimonas sediminis]|uniref:MarR family transcriptional regulator n=1 Tax=Salinimonas sediminis TaxID=2303538 RepID=A0A346NJ39_9ALTE|nr:MarR family transcriptional regulator [Salinimonas sediminis]AXR05546.1 MarR family transcriptional regulator [Salinimonas sediminis]
MNDDLMLKNQLCHRFYTVSNAFSRAYRPLLAKLDITYPQYVVLMSLWENEGITISDLVEHTQIDSGAMSLILKKLTSKGFLTVSQAQDDKRVKIVSLTAYGRKMRATASNIPQQMRCDIAALSDSQARTLIELIDKLSSGLQRSLCQRENES